ncbi:SDR family oxidoreductase [Rhizomonospora bruguierae]|uniref:SDR family oxidoreductase n=1 Tax=Rhizomonospora bruguierae TaxID=1581705 RepID=UPI001BCEB51A|nr:SDR family oxidoreductase [Micromonospora sp. NBRC 107566]
MGGPLAITGSTGRLGGRIARRLARAGVPQRLLVRDPRRAPELAGAEVAVAGYGDAAAVRAALAGVGTVLMVSAAENEHRLDEHRTFVDAAVAAGVRRLVYTSFAGASPGATFTLARDHWHTERHIAASGLAYTFLRDNLYLDFLPLMVGADGVIRGPAGEGRVAAVALDDIADVAVAVLRAADDRGSPHDGATYELSGPQALTMAEAAAALTRATGLRVTYRAETVPEAYRSRARYGAPPWQVDVWVSTYTAIAAGELAEVTDAVDRLCGRPPMSLEQLLGVTARLRELDR